MKCPSWDGVERFIFHQLILKTYIFKILCDYKKTTYVCSRIILGVFVNNKMNTACALVCFLLVSVSVLAGSHTLMGLATYIRGEKAFSASIMLDDITVGYYDSETKIYVARGNTTNEDDVIDPNTVRAVSENVLNHFTERSHCLRPVNDTESHVVYQVMLFCEQSDNTLGLISSKTAYQGSTFDELQIFDGKFEYKLFSNYTEPEKICNLERSKSNLEKVYYPACKKMLKNYLKKRETQLNRKVKPQVRLIQKANSDSGGSRVSCLATGFYPRHINLTLFRDGQTVSDHEITGGDLLPNADGTYQMRKSLEISAADKHKYTCSVTHLSLDNKLDIDLEFDPGEPFKSVISSVLIVSALVLVFGTGIVLCKCRRRRTASLKSDYSAASSSEENMDPAS
uniref:Ig-like domain-containing protein n=1 Tax=Cyprinus carpio TaxID=7962 RepID=A0A8C2BF39_CYPCA